MKVLLVFEYAEVIHRERVVAPLGRAVRIMFDKDDAGLKGAGQARQVLRNAGAKVGVVDVFKLYSNGPEGWNVADEILELHGQNFGSRS